MKTTVFVVALILGVTQATPVLEKKSAVHSRIVRGALEEKENGGFLSSSLMTIIEECRKNDFSAADEETLIEAIGAVKTCIDKKRVLVDPEEEFIKNVNECTKEVVKLSKQCLKEDQGYYPQFLIDTSNAYTAFFYADKETLSALDVKKCKNKVNEEEIAREWTQCVAKSAQDAGATDDIPTNKAEACRIVVAITKCHPKMFTLHCEQTPMIKRFVDGYNKAIEAPCKDVSV